MHRPSEEGTWGLSGRGREGSPISFLVKRLDLKALYTRPAGLGPAGRIVRSGRVAHRFYLLTHADDLIAI